MGDSVWGYDIGNAMRDVGQLYVQSKMQQAQLADMMAQRQLQREQLGLQTREFESGLPLKKSQEAENLARTLHLKTQTEGLTKQNEAQEAWRRLISGPYSPEPTVANARNQNLGQAMAGVLMGAPGSAVQQFAQFEAMRNDPDMRNRIATGTDLRPMILGQNQSGFDPRTGNLIGVGMVDTAPQHQKLVPTKPAARVGSMGLSPTSALLDTILQPATQGIGEPQQLFNAATGAQDWLGGAGGTLAAGWRILQDPNAIDFMETNMPGSSEQLRLILQMIYDKAKASQGGTMGARTGTLQPSGLPEGAIYGKDDQGRTGWQLPNGRFIPE